MGAGECAELLFRNLPPPAALFKEPRDVRPGPWKKKPCVLPPLAQTLTVTNKETCVITATRVQMLSVRAPRPPPRANTSTTSALFVVYLFYL